jgi:hypothetical protein
MGNSVCNIFHIFSVYLHNKHDPSCRLKRRKTTAGLDEGLNALSGKNPSAAGWFSRPIKCQILARTRDL